MRRYCRLKIIEFWGFLTLLKSQENILSIFRVRLAKPLTADIKNLVITFVDLRKSRCEMRNIWKIQ